jgi:serine/threonine-protein kinase
MPTTEQLAIALAGRYTIERQIGAGGMATVYLGHDVRHRRPVAVKFLNPELGAVVGAERFASEIQLTANLQHPHILPLFDSGEASLPGYTPGHGLLFYVMPYVDGETLRQRLTRERQLSIDEAVRITRAVASALDYAHRHGVIHRDLKPENILLHDGEPLVADFGIALALSNAAGERITQSGISLGTPQYMSPEQAAGDRQLDARSDVYSLGTVLYEMLAGEPPHTGPTVQAVISKVISEPARPIEQLRHTVPEYVNDALEEALAKVPADRFATAGEFSAALTHRASARATAHRVVGRSHRVWVKSVAVAALGVVLGATFTRVFWKGASGDNEPAIAPAVVRGTIDLPPEAPLALGVDVPTTGYIGPLAALSSDGAWLAWVAETSTGRMVYLREMSTGDARPLAGTEGAIHAFFSPDSKWIGFLTVDHVSKIPREGGAVTRLCNAETPVLGWWITPEVIHFTEREAYVLSRVSAYGGIPERVVRAADLPPSKYNVRFSDVLDSGRFALASRTTISGDQGDVALIDVASRKIVPLVRDAYHGRYVAPDHLMFARAGAIYRVRFDPALGTTSGEPVKLVTGVTTESLTDVSHVAFSKNGVIAFLPGSDLSVGRPAWIDRGGKVTYIDGLQERVYGVLDLSPDGQRIAVEIPDMNDFLWIWDLRRGEGRKAAFQGLERGPMWSRDGRHLSAVTMDSASKIRPVIHNVDSGGLVGAGLVPSGAMERAILSWSPNGDTLLIGTRMGRRIARLRELNDPSRSDSVKGLAGVEFPQISPDGHWITFTSAQGGTTEVWLQSFPQGESARQISLAGGMEPRWLPSGDLFYRVGYRWWTTRVSTTGTPAWDPPRKVFETEDFIDTAGWSYDVSNDGQRLLIVKRTHPLVRSKIEVITNWTAMLERTN